MNTSKAAFHALFSKNKAKKSTGIPLSAGMVLVTLGSINGRCSSCSRCKG